LLTTVKLGICIPTSGMCRTWFTYSLANLVARVGSLRFPPTIKSFELSLFVQETSVIHANREKLVEEALGWGATHILFLDDDMAFDPPVLELLFSRHQPMVACNYPKRGFPITFTAVRADMQGTIVTTEHSTGLEEAYYTGFGVALIDAEVFKKMPQPWFMPLYVAEQKQYTTEDNPFCERLRAAGFKVFVDHDASKIVTHIGTHSYKWDQYSPEKQDG